MKVKKDIISIPNEINKLADEEAQTFPANVVKANQKKIKNYIKSAREHLETLKTTLFQVIDTGYPNAEHYKIETGAKSTELDYSTETSSAFLEKAYTIQEYGAAGEALQNRCQNYIQAGMDFTKYCEDNAARLTPDQLFLNDAGAMIGAVNSALSQLNKVESSLDNNHYEQAGGELLVVDGCINNIIEQTINSKLVHLVPNQNLLEQLLSALVDMVLSIGDTLSNWGKTQEQQNQQRFFAIKQQYKANPEHHAEEDLPGQGPALQTL